jgi:TRAP-type mannitol/chloroaromatic compound transport system substrate-binding protein
MPAAAFFTTVPFGLTPGEHVAWVDAGGGQALWDELYAPFGVKPFMGGNTGVCMGGWFRNEIKGKADLSGTKIRSLGLGGEVYRRLGATPQTTPPAEILTSLQSGVIDAVEFVGPGTDIALGLYRVASFYYYPGFNKPNGTGECIVSLNAWNALDSELKSIVAHSLRRGGQLRAGRDGTAQHRGAGGADRPAPRAVAGVPAGPDHGARGISTDVLGDLGGRSPVARKVHDSYVAFRERTGAWSRISIKSVLDARES